MEHITIKGGEKISGKIAVQGSKNAVLPALAATILNAGKTTLTNCPDISDVKITLRILSFLGCKIEKDGGVITVDATEIKNNYIPHDMMTKMQRLNEIKNLYQDVLKDWTDEFQGLFIDDMNINPY